MKSFWLCLAITMILSCAVSRMEKESDTTIYAAFYDESGNYKKLLEAYQGLVHFQACDSAAQVQRQVLTGKADCGYMLPKNLEEKINTLQTDGCIQVWEAEDGFFAPIVNEVLFERVYTEASVQWYEDYIDSLYSGSNVAAVRKLAAQALNKRLTDGSTFTFERQVVQPSQTQEKGNATYPVRLIIIFQIILCGLTGVIQALKDYRLHYFYKRPYILTSIITITQPMLAACIAGAVIMLFYNSY